MNKRTGGIMCIVLAAGFLWSEGAVLAQSRKRAEVPVEHTWRLEDLYKTDGACFYLKTGTEIILKKRQCKWYP